MKILLTGSTGFIGKYLLKELHANSNKVHAIVRPTTNTEFLDNLKIKYFVYNSNINDLIDFMKSNSFDGIIHLASLYLKDHKPSDINDLINSNLLFSTNVLEAAVQSNIKWFLNTGTFWQHFNSKDYSPVNLYSATKQAFEDIAYFYIENNMIYFVNLKLNDTYGPNDTRRKIINLWFDIAKNKETLNMSAGEQIIDIMYIDDVVSAFMKLAPIINDDKEYIYNNKSFVVTSPQRVTLKELSQIFESVTGKKLEINWGSMPYREKEVMIPWENSKTVPGWKASISLQEGIKRVSSFYFNDN